jgi:hypothetical protein
LEKGVKDQGSEMATDYTKPLRNHFRELQEKKKGIRDSYEILGTT